MVMLLLLLLLKWVLLSTESNARNLPKNIIFLFLKKSIQKIAAVSKKFKLKKIKPKWFYDQNVKYLKQIVVTTDIGIFSIVSKGSLKGILN